MKYDRYFFHSEFKRHLQNSEDLLSEIGAYQATLDKYIKQIESGEYAWELLLPICRDLRFAELAFESLGRTLDRLKELP